MSVFPPERPSHDSVRNELCATLISSTLALLLVQSPARAQPANGFGEGQHLFQIHCATCHGHRGEGDRGPTLAVPRLVRAPTDEALLKIIAEGIPGTEMPPFSFADDQAAMIVAWVP